MPMRLELGALTVEVERQEDAADFLRGLFRHLNNKEVADLLGVTDKTVRRWRRAGRLPTRGGGQLTLLDLLHHLGPGAQPSDATPRHPRLTARLQDTTAAAAD
ncbi:MAG TPA: helix-turn-helix domain-containing protein [bacterium]|nr:helix-turn-helix domain-containing protein [bacterium]